MSNSIIPKQELENRLKEALFQFAYPVRSVKCFLHSANALMDFMDMRGWLNYDKSVGEEFVRHYLQNGNGSIKHKKRKVHVVRLLNLIMDGEPLSIGRGCMPLPPMTGNFAPPAYAFLEYLVSEKRLKPDSVKFYHLVLSRFSLCMQFKNVTPQTLSWDDIQFFISSSLNANSNRVSYLRRFLTKMKDDGIIHSDFSDMLRVMRLAPKEKLPSVYTPAEVKNIESTVNRATRTGKRDFAIILLASRLGLRSSDIRELQFSNIDWDNNTIKLIQYKTKRPLELPLLNDVGEAIIDYVMNVRPKISAPNIFITAHAPYKSMTASAISNLVRRYINRACVDKAERHTGLHALRHSLATLLLTNGTKLEVISDSLGHASSRTTECYLGVSINMLIECSHDVPKIPPSFYNQGGGALYE